MLNREMEPLTDTNWFQEFARSLPVEYLFQDRVLFVRTPCLLCVIYGYIIEDVIYCDIYDPVTNRQTTIDRCMDAIPDLNAAVEIIQFYKAHHRTVIGPLDSPGTRQAEAYFFAYLDILRKLMPDLVACDPSRYMEQFDPAFPIFPTHYASALGRFQAGWGRTGAARPIGSETALDRGVAERALYRFVLAQHQLIESVHGTRNPTDPNLEPAQRHAASRWMPHALPQLEHHHGLLREAVRSALSGDFQPALGVAGAYRESGPWREGLAVELAPEDSRQELRWAIDAVVRTAADVERAASVAGSSPVGSIPPRPPEPSAASASLVERSLYRVALAHDHLLRTIRAEATGLDGAPALQGLLDADTDALRAAIAAAHAGDRRPAAGAARASAQHARQVLAMAQPGAMRQLARQVLDLVQPRSSTPAPAAQRRIAAAAAELGLWAERAQLTTSPQS
jgi:hypothetical protein